MDAIFLHHIMHNYIYNLQIEPWLMANRGAVICQCV